MKKQWVIFVIAAAVVFTCDAFGEEKLHSWVANALGKIPPKLEKAENLASQGDMANAKVYLDSAQKEWDQMHISLRDKFKDDNSEIVAVRKQLEEVTAKVLGADAAKKVTSEVKTQEEVPKKLDSMVAYSLKKIPPKLEKAQNLAKQGDIVNARVYLDSAQGEWQRIQTSYKDKFDENHPDVVAVRNQFKVVKTVIASGAAPKAETNAESSPIDGPAANDPLPSTMVYEMKQFNKALDRTLEEAPTMNIEKARQYLEKDHPWYLKKEWNRGKFNPQHPDILAMDAKVVAAKEAVAARVAKADDAEANLGVVLAAIKQNAEALKAAHEDAKWKVRSISSTISDGDQRKLTVELEKTRGAVERVNALLPAAREAVTVFRKQYPDMKEMEDLVENGLEARNVVLQVERFPKNWLEEVGREVSTALDEAEGNIKMYGLDQLADIEGSDKARQDYAADSSEKHVIIFSSILLETIDVLLPELPESDKAVLPEFVQARQDALDRAAPMKRNIAKVEAAVRKVRSDIVDAEHRKLAAARFPQSEYHGGKWDDAEKLIRKAFETKIKDKKLLKIDIYLPWEVREEAKWRNDRWVIKTYRYVGANCLTRLASGKYIVYRMNFRNTKMADGSWSTLEQWSVGHVYEILQENIDK